METPAGALLAHDRPLYSIPEAANVLHVSTRKVRYLLTSGRLRRVKIGRSTMIRRDDLEGIIAEKSGGPASRYGVGERGDV
jgi:excisionase family DNA binding protein